MWIAVGAAALWTAVVIGGADTNNKYVRTPLCQIEMNGSEMTKHCNAKQFGHHDKSSSLGYRY